METIFLLIAGLIDLLIEQIKKHKKQYIIGAIAVTLVFFILLIALASIGNSGGENGDTRRCDSCHKVYERYDDWGDLDDDYSSIQRRGMCEKCYQNYQWSH